MAPTTMTGQKTTTSPDGRDEAGAGPAIKMSEIMAGLGGTAYVARCAVDTPKNLMKAKKIIKKACEPQLNGEGFAFVEVLSSCPTNWGMSPQDANRRVTEEMIPYFPLGVFKGGDK